MARQLDGRVAIVTGASNGIGRAIAEGLAVEGAKTYLAARRKELLQSVVQGIHGQGGEAFAVATDVTVESEVTALFATAKRTHGRVDILVNNAGVATSTPTEDITLTYWQEVLAVNLTAAFLCSREAVRTMKTQSPKGGRIINVGSISAKTPRPDSLPYTATKFALQGMTHQLTMDGRKHDIVASIIHPGATFSSFTAIDGRTGPGHGALPENYVMSADNIGKLVVLMCSLPAEVNLYEATILPNQQKSFISRG